jgi:hypothetical protein
MAFAFDTLGYAKKLREAGVEPTVAEAHAEAARDFVMAELVTKTDLAAIRQHLEQELQHLEQAIQHQTLRLTLRLGGIMVAGIGVLAALQRLL